jgi:sentrin-specific protease 7
MNTLDSATAQSPRMAGKQYGKPAMGTGQTKYLALLNDESDQSPKTPDGPNLRRSCPTDEPSHSSKRARTHNTLPSSDLIEVKDNDDTIASSPPGVIGDPFAAVAHDNVVNKARTRNAVSAMSQRSQGSTTSSQRKRMSPVASAFQATDALMNSHRKKSRASNKVILWKAGDNGYECQQPPAPSLQRELVTQTGACADQAISLSDDEAPSSLKARVQNLSEHKAKGHGQVLLQDEGSEDELHIQDPATISHKIVPVKTNGSTRINHSTEPRRGEAKTTSKSDTDQNEKLSEKFQRQEDPTDPIEGDDDELASPTTTRSSRKRSLSPSKRTTQANTAVTRKSQASALRGWSLKYVKSYDIEKCGPGLSMKQILSDKAFSVDHSDGHTPPKTIAIVDLNKITKASADDASFIRIQGSKDTNGAIYWFDIEFENRQDLVDFRDYHVKPNCAGKIYLKNR